MRTASRLLVVPAALALLALTACGPSGSPLGEPQDVRVDQSSSGTNGTVTVVVESAEPQPASAMEEINLDAEEREMTPVFVTFSVTLTDGTYGDNETYPFSHYRWEARGTDGQSAISMGIMGVFEPCNGFSGDMAEQLAAGETVTGCTIFLTGGDGLASVKLENRTWLVD